MKISHKADYALHAMMYIAGVEGKHLCTITEISEGENIPREYAAKILKELTQKGFIISKRGIMGGYKMAKPRAQITFLQIMEAMEGPLSLSFCNLPDAKRQGLHRKGQCAATPFFADLQKKVTSELSGMTFGKLDYDKYYSNKQSAKAK